MNITKSEFFMASAMLAAKRSKDPSTQTGTVIVNTDNRIIATGYNGFPNGCKNDFPWEREGISLETKYPYVVHAEVNAVMNATSSTVGSTMYCTLFPCNECAKVIIQAGIKKVIYGSDKYANMEFTIAAKKLFVAAHVKCRPYVNLFDIRLHRTTDDE
jgi:dCMP deaminase